MSDASPKHLRSSAWFGAGTTGRSATIHRSAFRSQGFSPRVVDGRPVIGIANSASQLAPCNAHLGGLAEAVKRGVWEAGGFPVEFPTISLGEQLMRPTTMLYRNLMALEVEELIRANPLDGVVLLSGCDKTTPAMLMGAASVDLPAVLISGGPSLNGKYRGQDVGSGTQVWRLEQQQMAGELTEEERQFAEGCTSRSAGHCMTMGTASTMASIAEALGMQLTGMSSFPAVDARRYQMTQDVGVRIVELVREQITPSRIMTRGAFENAVRVNAAVGGSTNAIVHLLAIAGRVGVPLTLDEMHELARPVPLLVDLMPSGRFLMEDFCYAGGLPALMKELGDLLNTDELTVSGRTIGEAVARAQVWNREVIRTLDEPVLPPDSGTAVLRGNLCPGGAVLKRSAASPHLMKHRGQALVFESADAYHAVAGDPDLPVDETTVIVVRNSGPVGYPGMPEIANVPVPAKLLHRGVTDVVRLSDGRMSGTAFGTVIVHVAPEAAVGGPIGLVRTGDWIELDVAERRLTLDVDDAELERRRAEWTPPAAEAEEPGVGGGYTWLYKQHVLQADRGVDFDFLVGSRGPAVPRDSH